MNNIDELTSHLANLIKTLYKVSTQDMEDAEDTIFSSCLPSNSIDPLKLNNQNQIKDQFLTDSVPSANQVTWSVTHNTSLSQKVQEVLQKVSKIYEIENIEISNEDMRRVSHQIEDINENIETCNVKIEQNKKKLKRNQDQDEFIIQNIQKQKKIISEENDKMNEIIQKNVYAAIKIQQVKIQNQMSQNGSLPVNFYPENIKEILAADQKNDLQFGYEKFNYNSLDIQEQINILQDTFIQKLGEKLQGYGIGSMVSGEKLSIQDAFKSMQIELEWKRIDFKRDWLNINLLKVLLGELEAHEQQLSGENNNQMGLSKIIPFVQVAAIVVKNIQIKGVNASRIIRKKLMKMQAEPELSSFILQFQTAPGFQLDDNLNIKMSNPRILGYILKPIIPIQKEESEVEYSLTDNSSILKKLQQKHDFSLQDLYWPKKQQIKVRFIGQDPSQKYFINLSNLYKECIEEWIQKIPLQIDIDESSNYSIYQDYRDGYELLHVKIDESGQVFTLGIGKDLQKLKQDSDYNQLFGLKEFNHLVRQQYPNSQIKQKCKRIILHELGYVIGLIQEFNNIDVQIDKQKVFKLYLKYIQKLQNDKLIQISHGDIENEVNQRIEINVINKRTTSNFDQFDERSIMYQPFPNQWLKQPKQIQPNEYVSSKDSSLLNSHYAIFQTYNFQFPISDSPNKNILRSNFINPMDNEMNRNFILEQQNQSSNQISLISQQPQVNQHTNFQKRGQLKLQKIQSQNNSDQSINQNLFVSQQSEEKKEFQESPSRIPGNQSYINQINDQQKIYNESNLTKDFRKSINIDEIRQQPNQQSIVQQSEFKLNLEEAGKIEISNQYPKQNTNTQKQTDQYINIKNPQSNIEPFINDSNSSQSKEISIIKMNQDDIQPRIQKYHPEIEKQRDDIILLIEEYDVNTIIDCVKEYVENIPNWEYQVKQLIKEIQAQFSNPEKNKNEVDKDFMNIQIPQIDPKIKQLLVKILIDRQFNSNTSDTIYLKQSIPLQTLQNLKRYFDKYGAISNKEEELTDIELQNCIQLMKKQENCDFIQIKNQTLIHEILLEKIYNNQINKIKIHKQLIDCFLQINQIKYEYDQIVKMIFQENIKLRDNLIAIFKNSYDDYNKIMKLCIKNKIALFLLENEVEEFLRGIQNDKNPIIKEKQLQFLKNHLIRVDQAYCLQLLYYINKEQMQEEGLQQQIQQVDPKQTWAIQNKNYNIIPVNQNKNIARVINKGFLINTSGDIKEAYFFQKKYEESRLFENEDKEEVAQFLEDFKKYSTSNIPYKDKYDQFLNQILKSKFKFQQKEEEYQFVEQYLKEEEGYEQLMKNLGKRNRIENDDKEKEDNDDIEYQHLEQISQNLKIAIVLHQEEDFKNFKAYGSNFNAIQPINIIDHSKNSTYSILRLINLQIKLDVINVEAFKARNKDIYDLLPLWMQTFFGYKSLLNYIKDPVKMNVKQKEIDNLDDLVKIYQRYEKEPSDDLQRMVQQQCITIINQDKFIFEEWYEHIKQSDQGKIFAQSYDLSMARTNPEYMLKIQRDTKDLFPDPDELLTLKDFNRLSVRTDKNELSKLFQESLYDPKVFSRNVINQLFGFLNRRESMQSFVSDLKYIGLKVQISARFLINYLMQICDLNLRSRIIYYQSEYFSIPLIMNCLVSYESRKQILKYIPEIAFNMLEGAGILNFAAGSRSIYQIGKSTILNDILFPVIESSHEAFEQQDKNIFSSGQVDVFFEKSFADKRNIVLMDGQGNLKEEAITSALILTDIVMLHFHRQDFDDQNQLADLKYKIQLIKDAKIKWNKQIHIMLIIRDAPESLILKSQINGKFSYQQYNQAKDLEDSIDSCVQLVNIGTLNKTQRIEKLYPLLQHFYSLVEVIGKNKSNHSFTKKNYIEKFLAQNSQNNQTTEVVKNVFKITEDFMNEVYKIQDNIFQEDALPVLNYKNKLRQKVIEIRSFVTQNGTNLMEEEQIHNELREIQKKLKSAKPSNILLKFHQIVLDPNSLMILQEIAQLLRIVTQNGIKEPKLRRDNLLSQNKNTNNQILSVNQINESDMKNQKLNEQLNEIDEEIYQKSISLEYFWRALTFYTDKVNSDYLKFSDNQPRQLIFENINKQLIYGSCQELIDGENLEFKGKILSEVIGKQYKADKVLVVCVIGPQSSGKSTLMNFAFGTQFFTSSGRCTKGIYFTLQQIPKEISGKSDVKWLLMLDTEGLQSPERTDAEYDRKIVLFAMLSADILIINNKGEINSTMIETLTMCCLTYDNLRKFCPCPEIVYINSQQNNSNKEVFIRQLQDMKQKVKEQSESETIDETANEILGVQNENLLIMGYAYNNVSIEMDKKKGVSKNNSFKGSVTNFGVETSEIFKLVKSFIDRKSSQLKQISFWLENSQQNWNLIDKYSSNLIKFSNLLELKNDKKVQAQLNKLWNEYFQKNSQYDDMKCNQEKQRLIEILKLHGIEEMKIELHKVEFTNDQEKEFDIKKYIIDPFNQWKLENNGLTVSSEKEHISQLKAKMDALQNEFKVMLRSKIQEEQMLIVNKNGHKRILTRANEIARDSQYKVMQNSEKKEYLENQFEQNWQMSLEEIQGIAQIEQMKKSYFNNLLKLFKSFNPFIHVAGDQHYNQLLDKINRYNIGSDKINSQRINLQQLENFIVSELIDSDDQEIQVQLEMGRKLFSFNNEMLYQIKEDPKERIFDLQKQEQYLFLKDLIQCDYVYTIIEDLNEDLDQEALSQQMLKELTLQKQKQVIKQSYNYYGHSFKEKIDVWEEDLPQQQSNLRLLLINLQEAGFLIKIKNKYNNQIQEMKPTFLDDKIDSIFEEFEPFGINKDISRTQNKQKWIANFVNELVFKRQNYVKIDPRISSIFKSKVFVLRNRKDPHQSFKDHQSEVAQLQNALFVPEPQIKYSATRLANNINPTAMKILINPIKSENDALVKWQKLSQIAQKVLNWKKIAMKIIESVYKVLGNNQYESSESNAEDEMNIENIMKLNQITYEQVKTLESELLTTKLREIINSELNSKMGLYMNEQMNARISWCAMLVTWIELFQKAVSSFNKQYNSLVSQKQQYQSVFYKMINEGKNDELTKQSTKAIIQDSYRLFIEKVQNDQKKIILEVLEEKRILFDNIQMYENIDSYYANEMKNDYNQYIQYVKDPVPIFEYHAKELKVDEIDVCISDSSKVAQDIIYENLITVYQIIKKLKEAINQSQIEWNKVQLSDYFNIEYGSSVLQIQEIYDLQDSFSPVINLVFRRILLGIFDMSSFQQMIENPLKQKMIYTFTPKSLQENGPLEIFSNYYLRNYLQQILDNPEQKYLLDFIIQRYQTYQLDENNKVFQIDVMIDEIEKKIDDYLNKLQKEGEYDENWFDVAGPILNLVNTAIGCKSKCKFCNRKCELAQHTQLESLHSCEQMGHQMRVFAGGNFQNERGDKFPSLLTCDMINPNTVIVLNDQKLIWKELLITQMQEWEVKYKQQNQIISKNANTYRAFWERAGQEFCKLNNYEYIDYEDNQNLITKMYEKTVIVIALDYSTSMGGSKWRNALRGAKELLEYLKQNHSNHKNVNIVIIYFNHECRVMFNDTLDVEIPNEVWTVQSTGGTIYGQAILECINRVQQFALSIKSGKIFFFTDGTAPYPREDLIVIQEKIRENQQIWKNQFGGNKLEILLMCELKENATLVLIERKLNEISHLYFGMNNCSILQNVDTSQIGQLMIENFQFNN